MGIIGRFGQRGGRDRIRLIKTRLHRDAKHRMSVKSQNATTSSSNDNAISLAKEAKPQFPELPFGIVKDTKHSDDQNTGRLGLIIEIDNATASVVRNEVMNLLNSKSNHSCTILEMANALAISENCRQSHSKIDEKSIGLAKSPSQKLEDRTRVTIDWGKRNKKVLSRKRFQSIRDRLWDKVFSRKAEKESMKARYQWVDALNRLEKCPSSRDKFIATWEEAKESLEDVLHFPPPEDQARSIETSRIPIPTSIKEDAFENLETAIENVQDNIQTLMVSNRKWKQLESYPSTGKFGVTGKEGYKGEEDELLETLKKKESIEKADLFFNARIRTAEDMANQLQKSEAVRELEKRRIAVEARKRAASLMRALNEDEREIVETAIDGHGRGDEVIAQVGADSVLRASMQTLKPGMWLNDEIIHYFYLMLAKRDEELCKNDPSRKRSHFFKSFFITKLLNEGNASCDGKYEYRNVKRWSKKVPGKDIFNLDKILFPINMGNMHWICAAIFMKDKRIEVYDSMGSSGGRYLEALFNYIQDEHMDKKKSPLPDVDSWQLVPTQRDTPRQTNGRFLRSIVHHELNK